jgi:hypothetical protein
MKHRSRQARRTARHGMSVRIILHGPRSLAATTQHAAARHADRRTLIQPLHTAPSRAGTLMVQTARPAVRTRGRAAVAPPTAHRTPFTIYRTAQRSVSVMTFMRVCLHAQHGAGTSAALVRQAHT